MNKVRLFINKVLHLFELRRIKTSQKVIYLTFDDGPEGEITDFVLAQLRGYNAKATFFCKGENAQINESQFLRLLSDGHSIGNHTFSHINSFNTNTNEYVRDVNKADSVLHSHLFRPPWGSLTLMAFLRLSLKYRIVYWSLISGDTYGKKLDLEKNMRDLCKRTRPGDIVLFHSCKIHENETRQILPLYLAWLKENNYKCESL